MTTTKHIIDTDTAPYTFEYHTIKEHRKCGVIEWKLENISLYLSEAQKSGSINGNRLREELTHQQVLNACVLDYLLTNSDLIPEVWKGRRIYFWGTVYQGIWPCNQGNLSVYYLYWVDDRWKRISCWIDDGGLRSDSPAAVLIS